VPRLRGHPRARPHPRARAQQLDVLIGVLGFFTLMATIQTVTYELRGRPAAGSALVLLALLLALGLAVRARRAPDR
jgi:hypothetical protein